MKISTTGHLRCKVEARTVASSLMCWGWGALKHELIPNQTIWDPLDGWMNEWTPRNEAQLYVMWPLCLSMCREMVEKLPGTHTYLLLGDAYINIQEVKEGGNGIHVWLEVSQFLFLWFWEGAQSQSDSTRSGWSFPISPNVICLRKSRPHKHGLHR